LEQLGIGSILCAAETEKYYIFAPSLINCTLFSWSMLNTGPKYEVWDEKKKGISSQVTHVLLRLRRT
jgi:hypothetical protein